MTVVVCFGTRDSDEDLTVRWLLFGEEDLAMGRNYTWLCECCFCLGTRDSDEELAIETFAFFILVTRDSDKDRTIQLLLFVLGRATQQQTWL